MWLSLACLCFNLCLLEQIAPVIENDLHGRDDDGDGNDEDNGDADVQVLPYPGNLLPVENFQALVCGKFQCQDAQIQFSLILCGFSQNRIDNEEYPG